MRPKAPPRDVAAEITALIIARIEAGTPPWKRPWALGTGGRPLRHCGTPYTGINNLYLWAVADAAGYKSRTWMTYRQASELGGQVRRGEKSAISVYFSSITKEDQAPTASPGDIRTIRFLRAYSVFNASQIDGLDAKFYPDEIPVEPLAPSIRQAAIDAFFAAIPAVIRYGGDQACYDRVNDIIRLPNPEAFASSDHLASTRTHECAHWSGNSNRLARTFGKKFGDDDYAREELIAEITAGLVCADLCLSNEVHDSHASYISHWLTILRADKTAIIKAAAKAEQAYKFLKAFSTEPAEPPAHAEREMEDA